MRSESKKSFKDGFELPEQELRRIFDVLMQQMGRVIQSSSPKASFEIRFRNGVIAEPSSIDEILTLENIGSGAITRLQIKVDDGQNTPISTMKLEFINVNENPDTEYAINYTIAGDDRDWVFITSSQIDERISKIKRFAIERIATSRQALSFFMLIVFTAFMAITLIWATGENRSETKGIDAIETQWKTGILKDPVEVMIALERNYANSRKFGNFTGNLFIPMVVVVGSVIMFFLVLFGWSHFFPSYNFMWGDYVRLYQRRRATGSFIFGGILLALVIAILANYITSLLGIGR